MQIPGGDGGIGVNTGYFGPGGGGASFWGGGGRAGLGLTEPFGYPGRAYGSGGGGADGFSGGVWAGNGMSGVILVVEF
jgi:hypothetical protein